MGNLVIAAPSSFLSRALPGHLKKYMTDHPNIKVEVIECTYGEALRLISKGKVDISFTMTRATEQGFTSTLFDHDEVIVVSQKGHYEKNLETIPVKRLIEEPFIVDIETAPLLQKQLKNARMTFASSDSFTIMSMVESGLGVSLLPLEATKGTNFDMSRRVSFGRRTCRRRVRSSSRCPCCFRRRGSCTRCRTARPCNSRQRTIRG